MDFGLLQVGINRYDGIPLRGCVNDCQNLVRQFDRFGLKPKYHQVLFDRDATRANILGNLRWLLDERLPTLIFQYSGHGARVPDRNGDERDGFDSAICPIDHESAGVILDDLLASVYAHCPADQRLIILFDSCHSGNSQRALVTRAKRAMFRSSVPRFLPQQMISRVPDPPKTYRVRHRTFVENSEHCVLISTCKPEQTSADAWIDKTWQGAGTAALLAAWRECGVRAVYGAVAAVANLWLKRNGYSQMLRIEGRAENKDRPIFS